MGTSIIVGVGVKDEGAKHWAQGYHRAISASSRGFAQTKAGAYSGTYSQYQLLIEFRVLARINRK